MIERIELLEEFLSLLWCHLSPGVEFNSLVAFLVFLDVYNGALIYKFNPLIDHVCNSVQFVDNINFPPSKRVVLVIAVMCSSTQKIFLFGGESMFLLRKHSILYYNIRCRWLLLLLPLLLASVFILS